MRLVVIFCLSLFMISCYDQSNSPSDNNNSISSLPTPSPTPTPTATPTPSPTPTPTPTPTPGPTPTFQIGTPMKLIDSSSNSYHYSYGASVIYAEGNYHAYFCSTGTGVVDWDHVRHSVSSDLVHWSAPTNFLVSTEVERANCDPSIVRYNAGDGLFYYLVYSGNVTNIQTVNFVARSASPNGPFLKLTDRGTWENNPKDSRAIIYPFYRNNPEGSGIYGAGQPSLVIKNGIVYQFYSDTTLSSSRLKPRVLMTTSKDLKNWSTAVPTNVESFSVDVKYDDDFNVFVMFEMLDQHNVGVQLSMRTSVDGVAWSSPKVVCDTNCFPDWANNVGISGDSSGHVMNRQFLVTYGAPYDLNPAYNNKCTGSNAGLCWGYWDLYGQIFSYEKGFTSPVKGYIDGLSADKKYLNGWACSSGLSMAIDVHLYAGGPAGVGTFVGLYTANVSNETAIADLCADGTPHRFRIALTNDQIQKFGNQAIYIHGISPLGWANSPLTESGKYNFPTSQ